MCVRKAEQFCALRQAHSFGWRNKNTILSYLRGIKAFW